MSNYLSFMFGQEHKTFYQQRSISLHWGLNPGPSVYRTDALPLSYRGSGRIAEKHVDTEKAQTGQEKLQSS